MSSSRQDDCYSLSSSHSSNLEDSPRQPLLKEYDYMGLTAATSSFSDSSCDGTSLYNRADAEEEEEAEDKEEEEEDDDNVFNKEAEQDLSLGLGSGSGSGSGSSSGSGLGFSLGLGLRLGLDNSSPAEKRLPVLSDEFRRTVPAAQKAPSSTTAGVSRTLPWDADESDAPPRKSQVVGWPPVRSFRRNTLEKSSALFVKVSMDGCAIGRKLDLLAYHNYAHLFQALRDMFQLQQGNNGRKIMMVGDTSSSSHFHNDLGLAYEDKDGDWMLVGDVPWSMFVNTVRRLRIMKTPVNPATKVMEHGHHKP